MANCEKILQTPELLELILVQLPIKDLLLARRISTTFNNLIQTSPTLQQALFFRPRPASSPPPTPPASSAPLRSHPTGDLVTETWQRNSLLTSAFPPWFDRPGLFISPEAFEMLPLASEQPAYLRPEASWRRMLVTQPPVTELGLLCEVSAMGGSSLKDGSAHFAHGLTMGALYDATCQEVLLVGRSRRDSMPNFRVQWHGAEGSVVFYTARSIGCVVRLREGYDPGVWDRYFSAAYEERSIVWHPN